MLKQIILPIIALFCANLSLAQSQTLNFMPQPNKVELSEGAFLLNNKVQIVYTDNSLTNEAILLQNQLKKLGHNLQRSTNGDRSISLLIDPQVIGKEAYRIRSNANRYTITANSSTGIFYGIQTFLQLFPIEEQVKQIPLVQIEDAPRFEWRGMHLDVSRHFSDVTEIKRLLAQMARLKLNVFHWHLTDDQGWRIEIPQYPRLTTVGSTRDSSLVGHLTCEPHQYEYEKVSGFYTQDDIKEVVSYATKLHINVMPEFEMPGHAQAALAAYPNLGCFPEDSVKVWPRWGVSENIFCAGKKETYEFIQNVLDEFVKLFPYNYIHLGGDECPTTHWKKCPLCQQKMKETGCKNEYELQSYLIAEMGKYLEKKGKNIVGWEDILKGGIPEGATIMSWHGEKGGIEASKLGHKAIMTPASVVYLDMLQSIDPEEPLSIGGLTTLEQAYKYDPAPFYLDEEVKQNIIGGQANLWREYIRSDAHTEYMYFPRVQALAEVFWTQPEKKDFNQFNQRLNEEYKRLNAAGINFRVPPPEGLSPIQLYQSPEAEIELHCLAETAKIYYTTDGSEPNTQSELYRGPFTLHIGNSLVFKSASYLPSGKRSYTTTSELKHHDLLGERTVSTEQGAHYEVFNGPFYSAKSVGGTPIEAGIVKYIHLSPSMLGNMRGIEFSGYLKIDTPGLHYFELKSICGSVFYIENQLLIDNDGFSYDNTRSGAIELQPGYYHFKLKYFNTNDGQSIQLLFKRPKAKRLSVFPNEKLYLLPNL